MADSAIWEQYVLTVEQNVTSVIMIGIPTLCLTGLKDLDLQQDLDLLAEQDLNLEKALIIQGNCPKILGHNKHNQISRGGHLHKEDLK